MKKASNILQFPHGNDQQDLMTCSDEYGDFDSWEVHYELHQNEDYPALVKYCEHFVLPDDIHTQERLGEAYLLNRQYQCVIDKIGVYNRSTPEDTVLVFIILEALFALGKTENDYDWLIQPQIMHCASEALNACYEHLRRKRKPVSVEALYTEVVKLAYCEFYLKFSSLDLYRALIQDHRFSLIEKKYPIIGSLFLTSKSR